MLLPPAKPARLIELARVCPADLVIKFRLTGAIPLVKKVYE